MIATKTLTFGPGNSLDARLDMPDAPKACVVLGHGSGSNLGVPVMKSLSAALLDAGFAVFRFNYPYSQSPDFVPYTDMPTDSPEVIMEIYKGAIEKAAQTAPGLALIAAGHSMSAYACVLSSAADLHPAVAQIALGYPSMGEPDREQKLVSASLPCLVIQGTEDSYGSYETLSQLQVRAPEVNIAWIKGAGHLFERGEEDLATPCAEVAGEIACFYEGLAR